MLLCLQENDLSAPIRIKGVPWLAATSCRAVLNVQPGEDRIGWRNEDNQIPSRPSVCLDCVG
jgi:hypothetical protein